MLHFLFLHAGAIKSAGRRWQNDQRMIWLYLGQNAESRNLAARHLGTSNRLSINKLLQDTALREKPAYLDFMAGLGLAQENKQKWWASNFAYKCPLTSDFFLLYCYGKVVEKLIMDRAASAPTTCVIVVEDRWLFRFFWRRYGHSVEHAEFAGRASVVPEIVKACVRGVAVRCHFVMRMAYHKLCSHWISKGSPLPRLPEGTAAACLYSWIEPRAVSNNPTYTDPYLGRLDGILRGLELKVIRLAPVNTPISLLRRAASMAEFVALGKHASLLDIIKSACSIFAMRIPSASADDAMRTLLRREMVLEFSRSAFSENVLHFRVFKRLFAAMNGGKLFVVYPFENQPWERMLCLAAEEFVDRVRPIGHEHSSVPQLMLNYFHGVKEAGQAPLPHYVITTCEHTRRLLKDNGYPAPAVLNGGSLRFGDGPKPPLLDNRATTVKKVVVIALPSLRALGAELLAAALESFHEAEYGAFTFLVKAHPDVPISVLGFGTETWPDHFQETEEPMAVLLRKTEILLYSSSTVGLEAITSGVPVVKYLSSSMLDLDILDEREDSELAVCDDTTMAAVVMEKLAPQAADAARLANARQQRYLGYFAPVNEKVWAHAVQMQTSDMGIHGCPKDFSF